jgi:hypothetical protein
MSTNTSGTYNTALGRQAFNSNSTGSYNVSLGYRAGYKSASGSNNIFLGTNAGYNESSSNKLYIDNTGDTTVPSSLTNSSTTALVYGDFASSPKILRTNSQFQIGDPATTGYKFPTARGTANQYLSTDGSGVLSWTSLAPVTTDWSTTGNASIVDGTNYIGTDAATDVDVAFRRKNLAAGKIGTTNTSFGLGALASNTGTNNTAHGVNALNATTSGTNNTALGYQAGNANVTGANNVLIGYQAGLINTTSGNINIGNQAGAAETTANKLYIENSNADANNALIYGEFDTNIVRANGQLQIGNPAVAGYALPTTRGTSGQVLQTDGSGATSWTSTTGVFPYSTTGSSTGVYNVALTQYTVRVFGSVSEVRLPTPIGNTGKVFVIIGSYGISSKTFSSVTGGIYDDVSNATITTISGSVRYTVQSDGTDWIVIGR